MSDNLLILHPKNPFAAYTEINHFKENLHKMGFIGEEYDWYGKIHYRLGGRFFDFIKFDHSHTILHLKNIPGGLKRILESDSSKSCNIHVQEVDPEPYFLGGANALSPTCPACQHEFLENPYVMINLWSEEKTTFRFLCPECEGSFMIHELDWHRTAGFARQQIEIWGVYEGEANPTKEFLSRLAEITEFEWTYFYSHY